MQLVFFQFMILQLLTRDLRIAKVLEIVNLTSTLTSNKNLLSISMRRLQLSAFASIAAFLNIGPKALCHLWKERCSCTPTHVAEGYGACSHREPSLPETERVTRFACSFWLSRVIAELCCSKRMPKLLV